VMCRNYPRLGLVRKRTNPEVAHNDIQKRQSIVVRETDSFTSIVHHGMYFPYLSQLPLPYCSLIRTNQLKTVALSRSAPEDASTSTPLRW
jgi:hypothetical protein